MEYPIYHFLCINSIISNNSVFSVDLFFYHEYCYFLFYFIFCERKVILYVKLVILPSNSLNMQKIFIIDDYIYGDLT